MHVVVFPKLLVFFPKDNVLLSKVFHLLDILLLYLNCDGSLHREEIGLSYLNLLHQYNVNRERYDLHFIFPLIKDTFWF